MTVLLSAVAAWAAAQAQAQALGQQHGLQRLVPVVCLLMAAELGIWAVRRCLFHLGFAEALAHQAECPYRHTYAGWLAGWLADSPATDEFGNL